MRCDNDNGTSHVRHGHGNVNRAETGDSKAATERSRIMMLCYSGLTCQWVGVVALRFVWSADREAVSQHKQLCQILTVSACPADDFRSRNLNINQRL